MITILSYMQGLSGDFLAYQIHQNPGYVPVQLRPDSQNRYTLPCLTKPVFGWEVKNTRNQITPERMTALNTSYSNQHMILPTHQFQPVYNPDIRYVRLHSNDESIIRLSYAMWLFKSHKILQPPWMDRYDQICATPEPVRTELIQRYHKWKYMSYRYKLVPETGFNLRYYIHNYYKIYHNSIDISQNYREGYQYFGVGKILYDIEPEPLEEYLGIELDRTAIANYINANFDLLNTYGLDLNSPDFLDNLTDVLWPEMSQTINLDDYINENSSDIQSRFAGN